MSILYEQKPSDSPIVATIMRGQTVSDGCTIRPAENSWHMVFVSHTHGVQSLIVGPWTSAGIASWKAGAEILWIKFKLGVFMPHLSTRNFLNQEVSLTNASSTSFWLNGTAWQYPNYENVETFVGRLVREDVLVCDPVVTAALQDRLLEVPSRTVRHRFLRATGLSHSHIRQLERAQRAAALLHQGRSIADTLYDAGYFDQPHLTRALKQLIGQTPQQWIQHPPAETIRLSKPE